MSLKFYKNGMIVQDGPLRSYEDPATTSFLKDILDGYFPSELQEAYPEGVPFKVKHGFYVVMKGEEREVFLGCSYIWLLGGRSQEPIVLEHVRVSWPRLPIGKREPYQ